MENKLNSELYSSLIKGEASQLSDDLFIKLLAKSDFDDIVKMLSNINVNRYLFFAPAPPVVYGMFFNPLIEEIEQSILENKWSSSPVFVVRNNDGNFAGMIGITVTPFLDGNFEIGYQLPELAWGRGIATKLSKFALKIAFKELGAYRVGADCYSNNLGSIKVLEKVGLNKEGILKHYYKIEDEFDDKLLFGITKTDYSKL